MKHNHHMKTFLAVLLCGLLFCGQAFGITPAEDLDGQLEIRPSSPTASWPESSDSNELAPNYTATISVTVVESEEVGGVNYTLSSGPDATTGSTDTNVVWTESGTTFSITNTAADTASATMTLTCIWSPERGEGGGEGPGPEDIHGQADADVQLLDSVVDWDFDRTRQWADGEKELGFTVTITDDNGFGLENWTLTEFIADEADPANPGWEIIPVANAAGAPQWTLAANATSSTPSKGKVKIEYNDGSDEERTSTEEIAFIEIKLVKVAFSGSGYRTIRSDDGGTNYTAPHWNDPDGDGDPSDGHAYPVAYVSDTKLTVAPEWKLEPEVDGVNLKVKASGPDSISIDEVNAQVNGDKVDLASSAQATDEFEKDKVRYWEEFELAFEASFQGEDEWVEVGTSKNQLYVTRGAPAVSPLYHTVVHLGCSNADGETTESDIVDAIYAEFANRSVQRVDGIQMTYWAQDSSGVYQMGAQTTSALLAAPDGNGNCEAWSLLLRDMLRAQNISADRVIVAPLDLRERALLVKNWDFTGAGDTSQYFTHEYPTDVVVGAKLPAQGNSDPPPAFNAHWITRVGTEYFDPSYGTPKRSSLKEYEINAVSGFSNSRSRPANVHGARARRNDSDPASADELVEILANP